MNKNAISYVLETITPELAKRYLEQNRRNYRHLNNQLVGKYAKEMIDGTWHQGHPQGIVFDAHGDLADGQHRLAAIVLSGVTIRMWVFRGADREVCFDLDRGQIRKEADLLRARGFREDVDTRKAISVARYMLTGLKGGKPSECVRRYAKENETLIGTFLLEIGDTRPSRSEVVAAFCNATREYADDKVLECARRYAKHEITGPDDPLCSLRARLIDGIRSKRFMGTGLIYGLAATAIRASLEGRDLRLLRPATKDFVARPVRGEKNGCAHPQPGPTAAAAVLSPVATNRGAL